MGQLIAALALVILLLANYWASKARGPLFGKLVLLFTNLPAIAFVGFYGFKFAYAIVNADEVNRRYQDGDLTYFMADTAFAMSILFASLWALAAYAGYCLGHWEARNSNGH